MVVLCVVMGTVLGAAAGYCLWGKSPQAQAVLPRLSGEPAGVVCAQQQAEGWVTHSL